ncbi:MAG: DUF3040 domain-containing protein [Micrococcaceae bacterium]
MALSDNEKETLSFMEQQLKQEDPKLAKEFAQPLDGDAMKGLVIGILVTVVGLVVILLAVHFKLVILGIPAFLMMCGGVWLAYEKTEEQFRKRREVTRKNNANSPNGPQSPLSFLRDIENKLQDLYAGHDGPNGPGAAKSNQQQKPQGKPQSPIFGFDFTPQNKSPNLGPKNTPNGPKNPNKPGDDSNGSGPTNKNPHDPKDPKGPKNNGTGGNPFNFGF